MGTEKRSDLLTSVNEAIVVKFVRLRAITLFREDNRRRATPFAIRVVYEVDIFDCADCSSEQVLL